MSAARMSASRRDCSMTMTSDIHWDASISWLSRLCAVLIRASSISDFCSLCQEPAYQLIYMFRLVGGSCLAPHRRRGHLEAAPPFTVPCEGCEDWFLHRSHRESNPGPSRGSPLHNRCATPATGPLSWIYYELFLLYEV